MVYHLKICFTTIPTLKKEQSQLLLGVIQEVPFFLAPQRRQVRTACRSSAKAGNKSSATTGHTKGELHERKEGRKRWVIVLMVQKSGRTS